MLSLTPYAVILCQTVMNVALIGFMCYRARRCYKMQRFASQVKTLAPDIYQSAVHHARL